MAKEELSGKALHNVHKVVYMVNEYPSKTLPEIAALFHLPAIDINVAIWRAQDMGFFTVDDEGKATIHEVPKKWEFGELIDDLCNTIEYTFRRLARDEMDMEENIFGHWTAGYPVHDVMIAMKKLINDKVLVDYEIKDYTEEFLSKKAKGRGKKPEMKESIYTFYTLYENMEMRWGAKQFKEESRDSLK